MFQNESTNHLGSSADPSKSETFDTHRDMAKRKQNNLRKSFKSVDYTEVVQRRYQMFPKKASVDS
jgi:hypothetical protein